MDLKDLNDLKKKMKVFLYVIGMFNAATIFFFSTKGIWFGVFNAPVATIALWLYYREMGKNDALVKMNKDLLDAYSKSVEAYGDVKGKLDLVIELEKKEA